MAAEICEKVALLLGLNSLGNHRQAHCPAEGDDGLGNRAAAGIRQNVLNERPVDLELVQGQTLQVGQGGIAGAKIVE